MRVAWGELEMLSKNTCEGVHLIVKFIILFLEIISWKGASRFNGGFVFQVGGGGVPYGDASVLIGVFQNK